MASSSPARGRDPRLLRGELSCWVSAIIFLSKLWLAWARGLHIHISINIYARMHAYFYV